MLVYVIDGELGNVTDDELTLMALLNCFQIGIFSKMTIQTNEKPPFFIDEQTHEIRHYRLEQEPYKRKIQKTELSPVLNRDTGVIESKEIPVFDTVMKDDYYIGKDENGIRKPLLAENVECRQIPVKIPVLIDVDDTRPKAVEI